MFLWFNGRHGCQQSIYIASREKKEIGIKFTISEAEYMSSVFIIIVKLISGRWRYALDCPNKFGHFLNNNEFVEALVAVLC